LQSDPVFSRAAELAAEAGLSAVDTRELVRRLRAARSDKAALVLLDNEGTARLDVIQERTVKGTRRGAPRRTEFARARTTLTTVVEIDPQQILASCPTNEARQTLKDQLPAVIKHLRALDAVL
jgi:hypothetical protein